jgi:putative tricarboxylic transport membrane protein
MEDRDRRKGRPDRAAFVIAVALAIAAIVIAVSTSRMGGGGGYARIGPATFPYVIAVCLFALSVWTGVAAWREEFPERERQNTGPMLWIIGGLAAQMLLLKTAGFSIATGVLFALAARGFGGGPLYLTIPLGILLAFVVWIVFALGLQLSLPAGPLENLFF